MTALAVPADLKISALELDFDLILDKAMHHTCDCTRGRTRSARPGLPASALPYTHLHMLPVNHADKLRVHAIRETLMVLKIRSNLLEIQTIHILDIIDCMRIADTDSGKLKILSIHMNLLRKLTRQLRNSHIDRDCDNFSVF